MSSIYIPNTEMPKEKPIIIYPDGTVSELYGRILDTTPISLSDHGRLGDLDELVDRMVELLNSTRKYLAETSTEDSEKFNLGLIGGIDHVIGEIRYYTPTVIPTDREKKRGRCDEF